MKTKSTATERMKAEYWRNMARFNRWERKWRQAKASQDTVALQVMQGERPGR